MANINLRDYLAAISVKTENADLDKITILDSSDNNKIKTILKQDLVDLDAIASQLESEFVRVGGIVSSSDQLISDLDARYLNTFGDSVVSQSSQIDVTQTTNYGSINQYSDSDNLDYLNSINVISQSSQIDVTQTTNYGSINQYSDIKVKNKLTAEGVISASSQIVLNDADKEDFSTADVAENASFLYYTDARVKNKLTAENVISSSEQITILESQISDLTHYTDNDVKKKLNNDDVLSGSFKDKLTTENVISSSAQITILESQISDLTHYTDSDVKDKLNAENVISSSEQLGVNDSTITISGSDDGVVLINGVGGGEFTLNQSGDTTFTISLANGLVSGSVIREIPIGTISSSAQIYSTFSGSNLVSSSNQIIISQSQISDLTHYTDSDVLTYINSLAVQSGSDTPHYTDSDNLSYLNSLLVVSKSSGGDLDVNGAITASSFFIDGNTRTTGVHFANGLQHDGDGGTGIYFATDIVELRTQNNPSLRIDSTGNTTAYFDLNVIGNISGSTFNGTGLISGSSQITFNDISENPFISGSETITASGHFVPSQHETYDLGSSTKRWRTLYLSGSTIDLGGTLIKRGTDGNIRFIDRNTEVVKSIGIDSITGSLSITENLDVNGSITASRLELGDYIYHSGDSNSSFGFSADDQWRVATGGVLKLLVTNSDTTVNMNLIANQNVTLTDGDLNVNGSITASRLNLEDANNNILIGGQYGYVLDTTSGINNIFVGEGSGDALTTGDNNISIGVVALSSISDEASDGNVAIGYRSAYLMESGSYNTAIGYDSMKNADYSDYAVAVGFASLHESTGDYNVGIGYRAGHWGGSGFVGIGRDVGYGLNSGNTNNTGIGYLSLGGDGNLAAGGGDFNTTVGAYALGRLKNGMQNTVVGQAAGYLNLRDGSYNTLIGRAAGYEISTGDYNTLIGRFAGYSGAGAGAGIISGSGNTLLGAHSQTQNSDDYNSIVIGSGSIGKGSNTVVIGNDDVTTTYLKGKLNLVEKGYNLVIDSGPENQTGEQLSTLGNNNILLGRIAGDEIVAGDNNVGIGTNALGMISNEASDANVAIGEQSMYLFESGSHNVAIGRFAFRDGEDGSDDNVSIGTEAGRYANSDYSVSIGTYAGMHATIKGVYIGADVGLSLTTGSFYNTGVGSDSLGGDGVYNTGNGDYNSAFGYESLSKLRDGGYNTSIGARSSQLLTDGDLNTSVGYFSLPRVTTGNRNTGVGAGSFSFLSTGEYNTALGYQTGLNLVSGSGNTLLGYYADTQNSDDNNSIVIGSGSVGNGSNTVVIGNDSITSTELKGSITASSAQFTNGDLDVNGKLNLQYGAGNNIIIGDSETGQFVTSSNQALGNILLGNDAGKSLVDGDHNIFMGTNAGQNVENNFNIGIGYYALRNQAKTNQSNIAIGTNAGGFLSGSYNIAIGSYTLKDHSPNASNFYGSQIAIGYEAAKAGGYMGQVSIGTHAGEFMHNKVGHTLVGYYTGKRLGSQAAHNTSLGHYSLGGGTGGSNGLSSGSYNTAIGSSALENLEDGDHNVAIGYRALEALTDGYDNTAVGNDSLKAVTTGYNNVALGKNTAYNLTTGTENTVLGEFAGMNMVSASKNVVIGHNSGVFLKEGDGNVIIGDGARISASLDDTVPVNNSIVIGGSISTPTIGKGSNTVLIGNSYITDTYTRGTVHIEEVIKLTPLGSLPSGEDGMIASYNNQLWYHNGTDWQALAFA